jgi:NAD(P)-dependent dehydrogenase (short-subunit alcohol dehydrogenase family)
MTRRLEGKRVLVTGGGSGIGLAIADRFVQEGAQVAACDRDNTTSDTIEGVGAHFDLCDVADPDAVESWVNRSIDRLGGVDVVVANAGYELVGDALELTVEQWDHHVDVMLRGVWLTFRASLPTMSASGGGSLIAIGSNLAFVGLPRFTSYLASKHGVIGLVRGMAIDFADVGIRVNALCPGPTMTPLIERQLVGGDDPEALLAEWSASTILGRLGRPEEIAAGAVFLASDESSFVTGSALMVDGGYTAK